MKKCYKCGITDDKALLFDAISNEGIVNICRSCSYEEDIPIIRRPSEKQIEESKKMPSVSERISKMAGYKPVEKVVKPREILDQESDLRKIIDRKLLEKAKGAKPRDDLINNFHWILKRVRRMNHFTIKQLAEKIEETEAVIESAERGVIPVTPNFRIERKLEKALGLQLMKPDSRDKIEQAKKGFEVDFHRKGSDLTVADLKQMTREKEQKQISQIIENVYKADSEGFDEIDGFSEEEILRGEVKPKERFSIKKFFGF